LRKSSKREVAGLPESEFVRALACEYYCLGVIDGMTRSINSLKSLNSTPVPEFITPWHEILPPEIHALRLPKSSVKEAGAKLNQLMANTDVTRHLRLVPKTVSAESR
jgi:hypothetical protein